MYLTPKHKQIMLEFNRKQWKGQFDEEGEQIMHLCNELNSYDGVCAVYFSAGRLDVEYPAINVMPGQGFLWLWLDKEMFNRFHRNAFELLKKKPIKDMNVIYEEFISYQNCYPRQLAGLKAYIVQICFAGTRMEHFNEALDAIGLFIRSLSKQRLVTEDEVTIARYLTPDYKARVLEDFDDEKQNYNQYVEKEIVPFCDELNNTYDGVCTVMSCVGHKQWCTRGLMLGWGCLDLWLTKDMFDLFHLYAFELLKPPIENIEVHYMKSAYVLDQEAYVMRVLFRGKPMDALDESMEAIWVFIHSLTIFRASFRSFN